MIYTNSKPIVFNKHLRCVLNNFIAWITNAEIFTDLRLHLKIISGDSIGKLILLVHKISCTVD